MKDVMTSASAPKRLVKPLSRFFNILFRNVKCERLS